MSDIKQQLTNFRLQKFFNIVIILFLMALVAVSIDFVRNRAKDTRRRADIKQIQTALSVYNSKFNEYPEVTDNDLNGWDMSFDLVAKESQNFLKFLEEEKIIDRIPVDPINSGIYFYRYQKFPENSFGCKDAFYILQVMNFENSTDDHGWGDCPEKNFVAEAPNGYTIQIFE